MSKSKRSSAGQRLDKLDRRALLQLVSDLMKISAENRTFVRARLGGSPGSVRAAYRRRIVAQFLIGGELDLDAAYRSIAEYRRATGDVAGTLELMMTFVENGTQFGKEFPNVGDELYDSVGAVLAEFAELVSTRPYIRAGENGCTRWRR